MVTKVKAFIWLLPTVQSKEMLILNEGAFFPLNHSHSLLLCANHAKHRDPSQPLHDGSGPNRIQGPPHGPLSSSHSQI